MLLWARFQGNQGRHISWIAADIRYLASVDIWYFQLLFINRYPIFPSLNFVTDMISDIWKIRYLPISNISENPYAISEGSQWGTVHHAITQVGSTILHFHTTVFDHRCSVWQRTLYIRLYQFWDTLPCRRKEEEQEGRSFWQLPPSLLSLPGLISPVIYWYKHTYGMWNKTLD